MAKSRSKKVSSKKSSSKKAAKKAVSKKKATKKLVVRDATGNTVTAKKKVVKKGVNSSVVLEDGGLLGEIAKALNQITSRLTRIEKTLGLVTGVQQTLPRVAPVKEGELGTDAAQMALFDEGGTETAVVAITKEEVETAMKKVVKAKDMATVKNILSSFGATKMSDLLESDYNAVLHMCENSLTE